MLWTALPTVRWPYMSKRDADVHCGEVDVLLLSTYDTDGAGKFTHQLAGSLQSLGYSTRVVCVRNRSGDENTVGIIDRSPVDQIIYRLGEEVDRRLVRPRAEYAFIHLRGLPDRTVLGSDVWPQSCQLIICTFLSGMMSPSALLALRRRYGNPRVVFYGVDMNFYTAGCHYARDCTGYLSDCSACPAVPAFVRRKVERDFEAKKHAYEKIGPLVAVASSYEQHQQMTASKIFEGADIRKVLMAVDERLFGKYESTRMQLRKERRYKRRVLLIRSSSEPRKGCDLFIAAIRLIQEDDPNLVRNMTVLAIGDQYIADQLKGVKIDVQSPGYVADEDELSKLYASADVFLMTSFADSGPVMLAQSLMSGTPVISTDVGLARDIVHVPDSGAILNVPSKILLKENIVSFFSKSENATHSMRFKVRRMALQQLSTPVYLQKLSSLMRELLSR